MFKNHKNNCNCGVCRAIRGEYRGKPLKHKMDCQCYVCKAKRGEMKGKNHPLYNRKMNHKFDCKCAVCKAKRGEKKGIFPNHRKNCQCAYCNTQRGGFSHPMFGKKNELSPVWVGDRIKSGIHCWLRRDYGKAGCCENPNCLGKSKCFEWSKVDHNTPYTRNREEYQRLCHICHKGYDAKPIMINGRYGWIKII